MLNQRKLTILVLALSLTASSTAFANSGAPTSQFGFHGWPYRYQNGCWATEKPVQSASPSYTAAPAATPTPTAAPTSPPSVAPSAAPTPKPTQKPVKTPAPSNADDYTTGSVTAQEENAFIMLNQDRKANGVHALTLDPVLCELARLKSRDMHLNNYFSHNSPTYGTAKQMLSTYGYAFTSVSENIAHHATVEKAQAAFLSSANHRRTMLGSQWSKVGIGIWKDSQGFVYVTQLFVR